jgi:error-prone DNA polymerase
LVFTGYMGIEYVELQSMSNFSFLEGGSHPEELVQQSSSLGYKALSITDTNSFAGIVRGFFTAKDLGFKYITGCRLKAKKNITDNIFEVLAYPMTRSSYGKLCTLISKGNLDAEKGDCLLSLEEIIEIQKEIIFIIVPPRTIEGYSSVFENKKMEFKKQIDFFYNNIIDKRNIFLAFTYYYGNLETERHEFIHTLSKKYHIGLIATGDIVYHAPERKALQDIITCIREHCEIKKAGFLLKHNSERYLKPLSEICRLYRHHPEALKSTLHVAEACRFSLEELRYEYPSEVREGHTCAHEYLKKLTLEGAIVRYPDGIPQKVLELIEKELLLIKKLKYEDYFLTCYDIVKQAKSLGILCQGRGAAANSAVCFCLGITSVNPAKIELLFERFVSQARNEPPDIDIDFEHERREEIIQYIYDKYGRNRAGLVSNVINYRSRGAVREVGKALGFPLDTIDKVASIIYRWNDCKISKADLRGFGIDTESEVFKNWVRLSAELSGFPRHLSQHCGGFVISEKSLMETVPVLKSAMPSRTIIEWNKDDIDLLGMLKIDILALGMLSCIKKALEYINQKENTKPPLQLHSIPAEDPGVYDMLCKADSLGVFQVESRAQMSMLPRLKPRCFYDLVIEIAIVRPGPIHGNMVHPYLKRRMGIEKAFYPNEKVKSILEKTLGIPLFQEQAMRLVMAAADFTPEEAEKLRRSIAAWKRNEKSLTTYYDKIRQGMRKNGYENDFIENCLNQMKGFSEYGFPESHSASFALIVYASSWIKKYHPAEFAAALINSQPMGFYAPAQIIRDAIQHGVKVEPIDILKSEWDCTVLDGQGLRLGFRLIKGLQENQALNITAMRSLFPKLDSIEELYSLSNLSNLHIRRDSLAAIAKADGFGGMGLSQREALWKIKGLPKESAEFDPNFRDTLPQLPLMTLEQSMYSDYKFTGLSLKAHPMQLLRDELKKRAVVKSSELKNVPAKSVQKTAGLVICRQRPGTAKGTVFLTLEDEDGITNLIIWPNIYEKQHKIITSSTAVIAKGRIERTGDVMHMIVLNLESIDNLSKALKDSNLESLSYSY